MTERAPKVLVVDDEENIRFLVESALQLAGMETAGAEDGRAGLRLGDGLRADRRQTPLRSVSSANSAGGSETHASRFTQH